VRADVAIVQVRQGVTGNYLEHRATGPERRLRAETTRVLLGPSGQAHYSRSLIMDAGETIRARIQAALQDMLSARQSVWFR
jgi:hypothetical protein